MCIPVLPICLVFEGVVLGGAVEHRIRNASARQIPPEGFGQLPDEPDKMPNIRVVSYFGRMWDAAGRIWDAPGFQMQRGFSRISDSASHGQHP